MYTLIKNNKIELGPIQWSNIAFQNKLYSQGIVVTLPLTEPTDVIFLSDGFKIYPTEIVNASFNVDEYISGIELTFEENILYYIQLISKLSEEEQNKKRDEKKDLLKIQLRNIRKNEETSGVTVIIEGTPCVFATDRESQGMMSRTLQYMSTPINWKLKDGSWVVVSKEYMEYAIRKMGEHIQSTFDKEEIISKQIDSLNLFDAFTFDVEKEWSIL